MRKAPCLLFALLAAIVMVPTGLAQTQRKPLNQPQNANSQPRTDTSIRTSRVVGAGKASNHAVGTDLTPSRTDLTVAASSSPDVTPRGNENLPTNEGSRRAAGPVWGNAPVPVLESNSVPNRLSPPAEAASPSAALTRIYRVGVGDVLDIRLLNTPTRQSTLFTVLTGGVVEHPLIEEPMKVEGLRVEEIAARLTSKIKVIDNPRLLVKVRDHASHNVVVTGQVYNPGSKVLRQEAVPLYVVVAEAVVRPGAARATITRNGQTITIDLSDQTASSTLVVNGDLVKVFNAPPAAPQYYSVLGEINSPGEKSFRPGLTLTQSILASGGITQNASGRVRVKSQETGDASAILEVNVKEILEGRKPDPAIKPGDRVEMLRGRW